MSKTLEQAKADLLAMLDMVIGDMSSDMPTENDNPRMKPLPKGDKIEAYRDRALARIWVAVDEEASGGWHSDATLHKIGRSLHDIRVRDSVIWNFVQYGEGRENSLLSLGTKVADRMAVPDQAPILTVCAIIAWSIDDPMLPLFLRGVEQADPSYSMLHLLRGALDHGLPWEEWAEAMRELTLDACRHGA